MQILHRLWRFRDLRAVSLGAWPPADGVPIRCDASEWKGALPLPNLPKSSLARLGSRPAVPAALVGTCPESGAVPRGRQRQRAIRFCLSRERDCLPDRGCRAALIWQTVAHPGDGPARHWKHDRPPVGVATCLPVCAVACSPGWSADSLPVCMSACLPAGLSACVCPLPDR
ncbi:MAG: hypothetical protein FD150_1530 [Rhodobacteraceae bacterium]|nr:MAG: hypothetical protein FD150_1530 [Paracoccaceae bacterium]